MTPRPSKGTPRGKKKDLDGSAKRSAEPSAPNTKKELLARLKALGPVDAQTRNAVVCAMVGHSKIQTACFGYYTCGRCGAQVGDSLGGVYPGAESAVVIGHNCDKCRQNFKACTWKDLVFAPNPFPEVTKPIRRYIQPSPSKKARKA